MSSEKYRSLFYSFFGECDLYLLGSTTDMTHIEIVCAEASIYESENAFIAAALSGAHLIDEDVGLLKHLSIMIIGDGARH